MWKESAQKFIEGIKRIQDPDLLDPETVRRFGNRIAIKVRPQIEEEDGLRNHSLEGLFKVVR